MLMSCAKTVQSFQLQEKTLLRHYWFKQKEITETQFTRNFVRWCPSEGEAKASDDHGNKVTCSALRPACDCRAKGTKIAYGSAYLLQRDSQRKS